MRGRACEGFGGPAGRRCRAGCAGGCAARCVCGARQQLQSFLWSACTGAWPQWPQAPSPRKAPLPWQHVVAQRQAALLCGDPVCLHPPELKHLRCTHGARRAHASERRPRDWRQATKHLIWSVFWRQLQEDKNGTGHQHRICQPTRPALFLLLPSLGFAPLPLTISSRLEPRPGSSSAHRPHPPCGPPPSSRRSTRTFARGSQCLLPAGPSAPPPRASLAVTPVARAAQTRTRCCGCRSPSRARPPAQQSRHQPPRRAAAAAHQLCAEQPLFLLLLLLPLVQLPRLPSPRA